MTEFVWCLLVGSQQYHTSLRDGYIALDIGLDFCDLHLNRK